MAYKNSSQPAGGNEDALTIGPTTRKFNQWLAVKAEADLLAARLKELRDELMEEIPSAAIDVDETGSYWADLDAPIAGADGKVYSRLKRERHVKLTLKSIDDIRQVLGDELSSQVIKTRAEEYVDQDEVYELLREELITEEELMSCFDRNVTWYFKPKE